MRYCLKALLFGSWSEVGDWGLDVKEQKQWNIIAKHSQIPSHILKENVSTTVLIPLSATQLLYLASIICIVLWISFPHSFTWQICTSSGEKSITSAHLLHLCTRHVYLLCLHGTERTVNRQIVFLRKNHQIEHQQCSWSIKNVNTFYTQKIKELKVGFCIS